MAVEAFEFAHWSRLGSFYRVARKKFQTQRRAETFRSTSSYSRPPFSEERTALTCCSPHWFPLVPLAYWQAATNVNRLMSAPWSSQSSDRSQNRPRNLCSHLPSPPIRRLASSQLSTIQRHWRQPSQPLVVLLLHTPSSSFFYFPFRLINFFLSLKTPLKCHFFKKAFSVALGRSDLFTLCLYYFMFLFCMVADYQGCNEIIHYIMNHLVSVRLSVCKAPHGRSCVNSPWLGPVPHMVDAQ